MMSAAAMEAMGCGAKSAELDEACAHLGAKEHPAQDQDGDDRGPNVCGTEKGSEEARFKKHGFPAESEEALANIHDGEIEDVEQEPRGNREPDWPGFGESAERADGKNESDPRDDVEKAIGIFPAENAGRFAEGDAREICRNGEQAVLSEEGLELAQDGEEGDDVDCCHASLQEEAGDPEVAEIVVDREHAPLQAAWMRSDRVSRPWLSMDGFWCLERVSKTVAKGRRAVPQWLKPHVLRLTARMNSLLKKCSKQRKLSSGAKAAFKMRVLRMG